ncbi:MAG: uracil-DNA glycosylase [Bacilli bacterium]
MIGNDWDSILEFEYNKDYFKKLINLISEEYDKKIIFPKKEEIFNSLKHTKFENVKVVILGQDPYHGEGQAEGLSFSVKNDVKRPPSLNNIFKELESDISIKRNENSLINWADQGVLLLNSILTVEKAKPLSHKDIGWEIFTDYIIKKLNDKQSPIVFILWGNFAKSKKHLITNNIHKIIEGTHPSPFSAYRGFFGSKPFSKTNNFLEENKIERIRW